MTKQRIVAVGLLTQRDLDTLGHNFDRAFPIDETPCFDALLHAIDQADRDFSLVKYNASDEPVAGPSSQSEQETAARNE